MPEQTQQLHGPGRASRQFLNPIPMARLIRKHSYVAGGRGLHPELQILPLHRPSFRKEFVGFPLTPPPTTCFDKLSVRCFPLMCRECCFPFCLWLRTDHGEFPKPLELLSISAVQQLIIRPIRGNCFHFAGYFRSSGRACKREEPARLTGRHAPSLKIARRLSVP